MTHGVRLQMSVMMFLQYFVWGAWFVTLGTYMAAVGFGDFIGRAFSTQGIAAIVAPLFVGMIADRFFSAQVVLGVLHLIGAVLMYWLSTITGNAELFYLVTLGYMMTFMPTIAVSNTVAMNAMDDTTKQFASVRVLGTIGWIVAGLILSFVLAPLVAGGSGGLTIEQTNWPMKLAAGAALVLGLYSFTLPDTPPADRGKKIGSVMDILGLDIIRTIQGRAFWVFIVCSLLICIPLAFYYSYTNAFLVDKNAPNAVALQSMGQMSEIVFMLLLPFVLMRFGFKITLLIGMAAWALRYVMFAYSYEGAEIVLSLAIGGILLHGVCYDLFFVAGQIFVDRNLPPATRARAQSFLTLVTLGIGSLVGGELANATVNTNTVAGAVDWQTVWLIPAALAAAVALAFAVLFSERDRPKPKNEAEAAAF